MLFLDCEFDGYRGPLISIALVSDEGFDDDKRNEFYAVLQDTAKDEWVQQNVLPILLGKPEPRAAVAARLRAFFEEHDDEMVYADHAADFMYLMDLINEPNGDWQLGSLESLGMRLLNRDGDYVSALPHNALSDARALRRWYVGERKAPVKPVVSAGPNPRQTHR